MHGVGLLEVRNDEKTCVVEQELTPAREDGSLDTLAPTTTVTVLLDSSSGAHSLYLKVVDGEGNTQTFVISEYEALALCKGLQRATFYLHCNKQSALFM